MCDFNQAVILDSIRRSKEGLSRVELAGSAGLAAQTVSNICRRLLDSGLIVEAGKEASGPGKPRTILRLNPGGMYAVGVHIDPTLTSYALVDALGTVLVSEAEPTDLSVEPALAVALRRAGWQALAWPHPAPWTQRPEASSTRPT